MRKDELILLLEKVGLGLENQKVDLLDEENPDIDVPILKPDVVTTKPKDVEKEVEKTVTTFNEWLDWLKNLGKKHCEEGPFEVVGSKKKKKKIIQRRFQCQRMDICFEKVCKTIYNRGEIWIVS